MTKRWLIFLLLACTVTRISSHGATVEENKTQNTDAHGRINGLLVPSGVVGESPFPANELLEIAARHQMPMPRANARLVLAHTESWRVLGNESTSHDPAIYSPAFLVDERVGGSIVVLRGTDQQILETRHDQEPLWRPFSVIQQQPALGGYVTEFARLSAFVCAVQLAARDDRTTAQSIWRLVSASAWFTDGDPHESIAAELKNPRLLLGRCIYDHLKNRLMDEPQSWSDTYARMKSLFDEFPALKEEPRRKAVFDGLSAALSATTPPPNSTEALLVEWSRVPRQRNNAGFAHRQDSAEEPYRNIILRGADAVQDLIALLNDRRITTHEVPAIMNAPSRIILLGGLAQQLLQEITGIQGRSPWEAPNPAEFRAWLAKSQGPGEEKALVQSLFKREDGKITQVNEAPARILGQKFPEALSGLCEEFSRGAKTDAQPFALAKAVVAARLSKEAKVAILASFAQRGSLEHQRAVLQCLATLDSKRCAELLLPILRKLPPDSVGPYWTCPEAAFTHVVMLLEDDEIWRAYLQAAKRSSIGLRMEMMNPMNYTYIGQTNRSRRLAFLASFLSDETLREVTKNEAHSRFSGPCAAFTFKKITVRDFVAQQLASILDLPDHPDEFWTAAQWKALGDKVQLKLAAEKLPKL